MTIYSRTKLSSIKDYLKKQKTKILCERLYIKHFSPINMLTLSVVFGSYIWHNLLCVVARVTSRYLLKTPVLNFKQIKNRLIKKN